LMNFVAQDGVGDDIQQPRSLVLWNLSLQHVVPLSHVAP
jgi:hypothetical protein